MRLSALLLTLVIALGLTTPLEAKTKAPKAAKVHQTKNYKGPKRRTKPAKVKPMKFPKAKHSKGRKAPKVAKTHKAKPRTV